MNPIRRKHFGGYNIFLNGIAKPLKSWYAVCPECNEELKPGSWSGRSSRKIAKDMLYAHKLLKH